METFKVGHFGFSATPLKDLGASEYTLVTIVVDDSGSVGSYIRDIEKSLQTVVDACRLSPRMDNLMLRIVKFDSRVNEVHGFKLLADLQSYDNTLNGGGATALYEACVDGVKAMNTYGKSLIDQDYAVNGILVVITDGENNISTATRQDVKKEIDKAVAGENLESLVSILVGVGTGLTGYITDFKTEAGFSQCEMMQNLTAKNLAKLAEFISRSISSQSQALGSGNPSKSLVF